MIVGVLTTCHTQYTWDRSICFFYLIEQHSQVFVTYLTGALYVQHLWFYKHQHENRARSKLFVTCQRWWFQWRFWFVPSVPGYLREEEEHKPDPWRNPIEREITCDCVWRTRWQLLKPQQSFRITVYNTQKINHCGGNLEAMKLITNAITSNMEVLVSNPRKVLRVDTNHGYYETPHHGCKNRMQTEKGNIGNCDWQTRI